MPRVTAAEVKQVFDTSLEDDRLVPFIAQADLIIDEELVGRDLSDARLKLISQHLSAHYASLALDRRADQEGVAGATITYQGRTGMGFNATQYGQTALELDNSGRLRYLMKREGNTASFELIQ